MKKGKNDIQFIKTDIKLKLKSKTEELVSKDKELFANLSKEEITKEKKERANRFRKDNSDLLNENKLLTEREKISQYEESFDQREKKKILENEIKDSFFRESINRFKSVNDPGGISEIICSDTEGDVQLVAMENRNWIRMGQVLGGGGIRRTHYLSLMNGKDKLFSSDIIIRDEYYDYKDKRDEVILDARILSVENDKIVIAIQKYGKFEVKEFDSKNNKLLNDYSINYEQFEKIKNKNHKEKLGKSLEFEKYTFKIDSTGWKKEERKIYNRSRPVKVKVNATGDVVEYIEGEAKGEQIFITYDAFIREVCINKFGSDTPENRQLAEAKYLMTTEEFKLKMKDQGSGKEYKKFFDEEVNGHLAGYWHPDHKTFNNIGVRSNVWLAGGSHANFTQHGWLRGTGNRNYGFSGRLLKN